jgi:hypothetical protein
LQGKFLQVGSEKEKKLQERGPIMSETTLFQDQCFQVIELWQISAKSTIHHLENKGERMMLNT